MRKIDNNHLEVVFEMKSSNEIQKALVELKSSNYKEDKEFSTDLKSFLEGFEAALAWVTGGNNER